MYLQIVTCLNLLLMIILHNIAAIVIPIVNMPLSGTAVPVLL